MKGFCLFVFFAVIGSPTLAQIQHGTVAVVYYTEDKIIMAADSRGLLLTQNAQPDDSVCKIAAPYGKMLFVSSHAVAYKSGGLFDLVQPWSNVDEILSGL